MGTRYEQLSGVAPCGMHIDYVIERSTGCIIYTDIGIRGYNRYTAKNCDGCKWREPCHPTVPNYMEIIRDALGREVSPVEVIAQIFHDDWKDEDFRDYLKEEEKL